MQLSQNDMAMQAEKKMLKLPQVECPVFHYFGPSIYIREVHIPAGTFAVGHKQKTEHLNIMIKGSILVLNDDNEVKKLEAPLISTGKPGRKIGLALSDVIWQNIYATNETDIETLENTYLDKSEEWQSNNKAHLALMSEFAKSARDDFKKLVDELGVPEELIRTQSEDETDMVEFPQGTAPLFILRDSQIEGKGAFLSSSVTKGQIIAPAKIGDKRTPAGRFVNHSDNPNAFYETHESGIIYLIASKYISGSPCSGQGDEITVDYRQSLSEVLK